MVRRLLAFVLLLLIGGGLGWAVYDRQHGHRAPPADQAADAPAAGQAATGGSTPESPARAGAVAQSQSADHTSSAPAPTKPSQPSATTTEDAEAEPEHRAPRPAENEAVGLAEPHRPAGSGPGSRAAEVTQAPEAQSETARAEKGDRDRPAPPTVTAALPETTVKAKARAGPARQSAARDTVEKPAPPRETSADDPISRADHELGPAPAAGAEQALAEIKGEPQVAADPAPPLKPSFDIVRIGREGQAVIAGRAEPGAEVEVRLGARAIDRVKATRRGSWVSTPTEPIEPGDRELSLAARVQSGPLLESDQIVVVAVPERHPPPPQAGSPMEAGARVEPAALDQEAVASEPAPAAVERRARDAVALLMRKDDPGSGRVLQAPGWIGSGSELALVVLDYDDSGSIRLSGEGPPGAPVRVYVDNRVVGELQVSQDGTWRTVLDENLEPGSYMLRLDQLDAAGKPVARLETPFTRASQPPVEGEAQVDYVIVQPGNSLWRIARRVLGHGFAYVHIFEANKGQIRDPDLIYPGQVFAVPVGIGSQG